MNRAHIIFVLLMAGSGMLGGMASGCAHKKATTQFTEEDIPRVQTRWQQSPLRVNQEPTAVRQGQTPLAYIFVTGGPVRVVDLTAKIQVASGVVTDQTLVRVDDRPGVMAGQQTLTPGPLPTGHEYVIYADPTTDNVFRSGVGAPAPQSR